MTELEGNHVLHPGLAGLLQLVEHLLPFDRKEADRHIAVEAFKIGPAVDAILVCEFLVDAEVAVKLPVINLSVLEGHNVHNSLKVAEDIVPFALVLLVGRGGVASHHLVGLDAVYVRGNHTRQASGHFFGVASHIGKNLGNVSGAAADLLAKVPALEALVLLAVFLPNFVYELVVHIDFLLELTHVPPITGIIEAEEELHIVFVGKGEKHLDEVNRRIVAVRLSLKHRFKRSGNPRAEAATDHHYGVDAHILHCPEIGVPFFDAPVLVRNVPADFIEESSVYLHSLRNVRSLKLLVCELAAMAARHCQKGSKR